MRFDRTLVLACVAIAVLVAHAAHARPALDLDHDFWSSFAEPDESLDVKDELPDGLVMSYEEVGGGTTALSYDPCSETFALVIDDFSIPDLVTDVSAVSRPAFAGVFDASGTPAITGFVDLDPEGRFIVELTSSATSNRILVDEVTHEVIAFGKCKCPAVYVDLVCTKHDCDKATPPYCDVSDSVRCTWVTEEVASQ